MSAGDPHKEPNGQLVIDISRAGQGATEKVANTEVAKQTIMQGMSDVERLTGATIKDFHVLATEVAIDLNRMCFRSSYNCL